MRAPKESLRDFQAAAPKPTEPPAERSVRLSGKIAILKPVETRYELVRQRLPWFHRSLAVGGAFALILFVLGTVIDIAINGSRFEPAVAANDVATDLQSKRSRTPPKEPSPFPRFRLTNLPPASAMPDVVPTIVRRRLVRAR